MKIEDFHAEIVINEVKLRPGIFGLNFLSILSNFSLTAENDSKKS
jgi:hypothetical protein